MLRRLRLSKNTRHDDDLEFTCAGDGDIEVNCTPHTGGNTLRPSQSSPYLRIDTSTTRRLPPKEMYIDTDQDCSSAASAAASEFTATSGSTRSSVSSPPSSVPSRPVSISNKNKDLPRRPVSDHTPRTTRRRLSSFSAAHDRAHLRRSADAVPPVPPTPSFDFI